jgi:hypothetical protein
MNKKLAFLLILCLCCFSFKITAQVINAGTISGKVIDKNTGIGLELAVVNLFKDKDSVVLGTVITNKIGDFKINIKNTGKYELKISFIGYESLIRYVNLSARQASVDLGTIELMGGINLNTVVVNGGIVPLRIKKDTLEYDARAFKTAPNANLENLMRKLGGIEVDPYGNIKIHGLELSKVTVEGKKFFGDNYKIATQNLPADAISKIQVIESKTEEAIKSGIDDGKREKVINLVLKDEKKGGYFGSGNLAGGTNNRYLVSGNINHFNEKLQLNLLLMSNNNNQTYSVGEVGGFSGNNFGKGAVSGEANGVAFGRISQGLTATNSSALNFSKDWGKRIKNNLRSFYIGSLIDTKSDVQSYIQNIQTERTFLNDTHTLRENDNQSHSISFDFSSTIDSLNSYYISPTFGIEKSSSISNLFTGTANANGSLINKVNQNLYNNAFRPSISGFLSFRHKLRKNKGSYNFSLSQSYSKNQIDYFNINRTDFYNLDVLNSTVLINQLQNSNTLNSMLNFRGQLSYIISKDKKTSLLANGGVINSIRNADQLTFGYNPLNDRYEIVVPDLTNIYKNILTQKDVSLGINRSNSKTTFIATANLQAITLNGEINGNGQNFELKRNYLAILPRITFSYRTESRKSISFNINSNLSTPSLSDLQPVQNNLNQLYIREGNPLLKPAKNYSAQLSYNTFNVKNNSYANYGIYYSINADQFSTNNIFDESNAITYVKPINVNGGYSITANASYGGPIKKIKGLNINYGFSTSSQISINYINNLKNNTESNSLGANVGLNYSYKEILVLSFSNYSNYIDTRNSIRDNINNSYFKITNSGNFSYEFAKKWRVASDLNYQANLGRKDYFNQSMFLANAGIQRFLMPKDQLILEFKGYDLFNQNSNILRSFTANRVEDTQSINLRRYFLVKLTYKVNKIQSKK